MEITSWEKYEISSIDYWIYYLSSYLLYAQKRVDIVDFLQLIVVEDQNTNVLGVVLFRYFLEVFLGQVQHGLVVAIRWLCDRTSIMDYFKIEKELHFKYSS